MSAAKEEAHNRLAIRIMVLALLLCPSLPLQTRAQDAIPIQEALNRGLVSVRVEGVSASFYPTISMYVTNLSGEKIKVLVPMGMVLRSDQTGLSDLIVVGATEKTLQKAETDRLLEVSVYSTDINQEFSAHGAAYQVDNTIADADALALLHQAAQNDEPLAGQLALWMLVNNLNLEGVQAQIEQKITPNQQTEAVELFTQAGIPTPDMAQLPPTKTPPDRVTKEPPGGTDKPPEVTVEPTNEPDNGSSEIPIGIIVGGGLGLLLVAGIGIVINRKGLPFELPNLVGRRR